MREKDNKKKKELGREKEVIEGPERRKGREGMKRKKLLEFFTIEQQRKTE